MSDRILTFDLLNETLRYHYPYAISKCNYRGFMYSIETKHTSQLITPNHRMVVKFIADYKNWHGSVDHRGKAQMGIQKHWHFAEVADLTPHDGIVLPLAGHFVCSRDNLLLSKAMNAVLGWIITEGYRRKRGGYVITQSLSANPAKVDCIRADLQEAGVQFGERIGVDNRTKRQYVHFAVYKRQAAFELISSLIPEKELTPQLLDQPVDKLEVLFDRMMQGDGHRKPDYASEIFTQRADKQTADLFGILAVKLGKRAIEGSDSHSSDTSRNPTKVIHIHNRATAIIYPQYFGRGRGTKHFRQVKYEGRIWCPSVPNGAFVARRNGKIFITGNSYIAHLVAIFREVWRVLRRDGTAWVVMGDSYAGSGVHTSSHANPGLSCAGERGAAVPVPVAPGLKPKDLCGIPWRLAFALQADRWWLRSDVIWAKGLRFCEDYAGSCMPESVADRPSRAHEHVFLLAKDKRYFYDQKAVKEKLRRPEELTRKTPALFGGAHKHEGYGTRIASGNPYTEDPGGRNLRDVWALNPEAYPEAHFATFGLSLVTPMIRLATSQRGCCPKCGKHWRRVTKPTMRIDRAGVYDGKQQDREDQFSHKRIQMLVKAGREAGLPHDNTVVPKRTLGWRPVCFCDRTERWPKLPKKPKDKKLISAWEAECGSVWQARQELLEKWKPIPTVPAIVLDPFCGTGTTGEAARKLGRNFIGLDLSFPYLRDLALPRAERRTSRRAVQTLPLFQGVA